MSKTKPYVISKNIVYEAYLKVKANKGSAGIDEQSLEGFEQNLKDNLYKIWNRMSSGSYFPPAVKAVEIPKKAGGSRILGIPTVADRIAQMTVKLYFEPSVEPFFHVDSYGYRPKKSAIQALEITRKRCWKYNWVLEFDIKGLFDNIDHDLLMKAVDKHTQTDWIKLYIKRWLKAPFQMKEGIRERTSGTPQGGVISPVLANLFLHYTFDKWMAIYHPNIPFARYADDAVIHCKTEEEKLRILTSRKRPGTFHEIITKINQTTVGWINYYGISNMKGFMKEIQQWLHHRLRQLIWKRWKRVRTRYNMLRKYGISHEDAMRLANTRKGYWRASMNDIIHRAITNEKLTKWGLKDLSTLYELRYLKD